MSAYYLEHASVDHVQKHFDFFEEEARSLLSSGLAIGLLNYVFNSVLLAFQYFGCLARMSVLHRTLISKHDQCVQLSF